MKIQLHFSISFHLKMSYKDSICDTSKKTKYKLHKNHKNLNQQITINDQI